MDKKVIILGACFGVLFAILQFLTIGNSDDDTNGRKLVLPEIGANSKEVDSKKNAFTLINELFKDEFTRLENSRVVKVEEEKDKQVLTENPASVETVGLSLTDELAQTGDVQEVYVGQYKIILTGIFKSENWYATISKIDLKSNDIKNQRVTVGDNIQGYSIDKIGGKAVSLSKGEQMLTLQLFKPKR
jgi:hypothetical protein